MKLLLTSSGISNLSIRNVLVDLLGKPIAECSALVVPTAIYPFPDGAGQAFQAISGKAKSPLCDLGWKSVGVLELTALASIEKEVWVATVVESDALLVWGGDPVYLSYWMKHSGLADLLPSLRPETVYVGVSAGSIAMASTFGETYFDPPKCSGERVSSEDIVFAGPEGEITMTLVMAEGAGLVDFAIIPHVEYDDHQDVANAEKWAGRLPVPTYAIDDETAVKVIDGTVEVVSEGHWKLFNPLTQSGGPADRSRSVAFVADIGGPSRRWRCLPWFADVSNLGGRLLGVRMCLVGRRRREVSGCATANRAQQPTPMKPDIGYAVCPRCGRGQGEVLVRGRGPGGSSGNGES